MVLAVDALSFKHPNGPEEVLAEQFVTRQHLIHPAKLDDIEAGSKNLAQALFGVTESTSERALLVHLHIRQAGAVFGTEANHAQYPARF
jgi:hypothetical protein